MMRLLLSPFSDCSHLHRCSGFGVSQQTNNKESAHSEGLGKRLTTVMLFDAVGSLEELLQEADRWRLCTWLSGLGDIRWPGVLAAPASAHAHLQKGMRLLMRCDVMCVFLKNVPCEAEWLLAGWLEGVLRLLRTRPFVFHRVSLDVRDAELLMFGACMRLFSSCACVFLIVCDCRPCL